MIMLHSWFKFQDWVSDKEVKGYKIFRKLKLFDQLID
jgi:hypothetical protein